MPTRTCWSTTCSLPTLSTTSPISSTRSANPETFTRCPSSLWETRLTRSIAQDDRPSISTRGLRVDRGIEAVRERVTTMTIMIAFMTTTITIITITITTMTTSTTTVPRHRLPSIRSIQSTTDEAISMVVIVTSIVVGAITAITTATEDTTDPIRASPIDSLANLSFNMRRTISLSAILPIRSSPSGMPSTKNVQLTSPSRLAVYSGLWWRSLRRMVWTTGWRMRNRENAQFCDLSEYWLSGPMSCFLCLLVPLDELLDLFSDLVPMQIMYVCTHTYTICTTSTIYTYTYWRESKYNSTHKRISNSA